MVNSEPGPMDVTVVGGNGRRVGDDDGRLDGNEVWGVRPDGCDDGECVTATGAQIGVAVADDGGRLGHTDGDMVGMVDGRGVGASVR